MKGDIGLGNVDNTSDSTKNAATATPTNKTINGANNTLTVRLANDVTGNLPNANSRQDGDRHVQRGIFRARPQRRLT